MKIGVYGGTFNPPHLGHVTAARAVFELLKLDLLLLVPDGQPPHKMLPPGSPTPEQRLEMTRLAGEQLGLGERVRTLDLELKREGRSYTAETLRQLHQQYPEDELWLLMGTDMFLTLQAWREPGEILSLAGIAAFGRTEEDTEELFSVQRDYLYRTYPQARIFTLTIPGVVDVSSTELRTMLARGEGGNLLPPAVYGYILREGLYDTRADLKHLPLRTLRPVALSYLKHNASPTCWARSRRPSAWRSGTEPTWKRPGWRHCSTTARSGWTWRNSWPCADSTASGWTRWSSRP